MDWRALSRSRSRISMDWRPASRSRSRPPETTATFDQHGMLTSAAYDGRYVFPNVHDSFKSSDSKLSKGNLSTSPSIPIPGANSSILAFGRRSPPFHMLHHPQSELPSVYEDQSEAASENAESRYLQSLSYNHAFSTLNSPVFAPSSLPSSGLHGLSRIPSAPYNGSPHEPRGYPRHVRKTSFDHTVSRNGILAGLTGRHQFNGKPLPHDKLLGMKRRAETPHYESMLRADPSNINGVASQQELEHLEDDGSPFPSSAFNFSFPPYDGLFALPAASSANRQANYTPRLEGRYQEQQGQSAGRSSISNQPYRPGASSANEGLSAAAAAASAVMAEEYAQLNAANLAGVDDSLLDYGQILGLVYPGLDGSGPIAGRNPYTHVDPAQILAGDGGGGGTINSGAAGGGGILGGYPHFHASPSSDGWGNGVASSSTASPEPHTISNASTPPSTEGPAQTQGSRPAAANGRKYIPLKQDALRRKTSLSTGNSHSPTELRSSTSTPDLTSADNGAGEDLDQTPTLCTNCQTTNTPLWRRDSEGQPLCAYLFLNSMGNEAYLINFNSGNACGLFFVSCHYLCKSLVLKMPI